MQKKRFKHVLRDINQWSFATMAIGLFVAVPLLAIVVYIFDGPGEMWSHIVSYFLVDYIGNSAFLLLGSGVLCFIMGTSTAWIVSNYEFSFRKILEWLLFLPLAIPSYIVAYTYVGLFGNGGTLIGFFQDLGFTGQKVEFMNIFGLTWVLSCSLFPYVYAGTRAIFSSFPTSIREATQLLGVSRRRYFFSVALPLATPAITGGLFLVFMEVLNDYGAAKYYGINTFTTGIFRSWTMLEDIQSGIYLSAILVVLVFSLNALVVWQRGKRSFALKQSPSKQAAAKRIPLQGWKLITYSLVLCLPVVFGFILPVGQLLYWAILTFESMFKPELFWVALQSFGVAFSAALLVVLTALAMIYLSNWNVVRSFRVFKKLSTIGYVIPGAIIGIGIIRSSQSIIDFFDQVF
ncbi:MAG: ABC transporter permease subunit, partial [Bacteroidota bacterium]